MKQAQSKQKIIDKMVEAGLTEKVEQDRSIKFHFPDCGKLPPPVLAINGVSFSYDGKKENYLYTKLELSVDLDSRIALIGPNGVSPFPHLAPAPTVPVPPRADVRPRCAFLRPGGGRRSDVRRT